MVWFNNYWDQNCKNKIHELGRFDDKISNLQLDKPWSQYYENFSCFTKFSFHHKWNEVALRVVERLKTWEIRIVQNNGRWGSLSAHTRKKKTSWKYNLVPSLPPKKKILSVLAKDSLKIEIELFPLCAISHEN